VAARLRVRRHSQTTPPDRKLTAKAAAEGDLIATNDTMRTRTRFAGS
jgi:hypothetical protein